MSIIERITALFLNSIIAGPKRVKRSRGTSLGRVIEQGRITNMDLVLTTDDGLRHVAFEGITGSGKSNIIKRMLAANIFARLAVIVFDQHGELTETVAAVFRKLELTIGQSLSDFLVLIDLADPTHSVGWNLLEGGADSYAVRRVATFTAILRKQAGLEHLGSRTEELLRNGLLVLICIEETIIGLFRLLSDEAFLRQALSKVPFPDVRDYFEYRYLAVSENMRAVMREAILNKLSVLTVDRRLGHFFGQQKSTFSIRECMDSGRSILIRATKRDFGPDAAMVNALFLSQILDATFSRQKRTSVYVYADELPTLITDADAITTFYAEARKFGVGVVSANQFLAQLQPDMRAALFAVGTHGFFRLSPPDAEYVATLLGGGKTLAERLKNLPRGEMIVKTPSVMRHVRVAKADEADVDVSDLLKRVRARWARPRAEIEAEMVRRRPASPSVAAGPTEALDGWE